MKISPFIFLAILCIFVLPVTAIETSINAPTGITEWVAPEGYNFNVEEYYYTNVAAICWNNNISISYAPYTAINSLVVIGPSGYTIDDAIFTREYIYYVLNNGQVYRIPNKNGIITVSSLPPSDVTLITTCAGTVHWMVMDANDYIYVSSGNQIVRINTNTLTTSISVTNVNADYGLALLNDNSLISGGLATLSQNNFRYAKYTSMTSSSTITAIGSISSGASSYNRALFGMAGLTDGRFVAVEHIGTINSGAISVYNNTQFVQQLGTFSVSSGLSDIYVTNDGTVICALKGLNKIQTYEINGAGINYGGSAHIIPAKIEYSSIDLYTDYLNYYNMSNVDLHYTISFDTSKQSPEFVSKQNILNRFSWSIELIDPNGVMIQSYMLSEDFKSRSLLSSEYYITSSVTAQSVTPNGTWTFFLFERDSTTSEKALLDSCSITVMEETQNSQGVITSKDPKNIVNNFLQSPYFVAIIIIGVVGFQFGRGRDGNINGTAMIVLIPLAVGLCCLMGILPMWILYVMVLCIVAFVAVKMSTGGS